MRYGIIGNCQYSALVDDHANVVWLCWPRFDSSFVFGGMLSETSGGRFSIAPPDGRAGVQRYVGHTNILATRFDTDRGSFEVIDFAPRFPQYDRYYKPTTMVRIVRPIEGEPLVKVVCEPRGDYGRAKLVSDLGSNHIHFSGAERPIRLTTDVPLTLIEEGRPFPLTKPHHFILTYGRPLEAPLVTTVHDFLDRTEAYWRRWVKHCHLPGQYQEEVIRSALVLKLHQFEDTGAVIAATTMALPEAAGSGRTWDYRYCWLRDAHYTVGALARLSHFEELEGFVRFLRGILEVDGPDLKPLYAVDGRSDIPESILTHLEGYKGEGPVRVGNAAALQTQNDLYGEMLLSIAPWFSDVRFQHDDPEPMRRTLESLVNSLAARGEKPDAGIWEFRGEQRLFAFTALINWAGATKAAAFAASLGMNDLAATAGDTAKRLARRLDTDLWHPDKKRFRQGVGIEDADAATLVAIDLGFFAPNDPRARTHVAATAEELMTSAGLLKRYGRHDDFGETENSFLVCSFWLVEALARLGDKAEATEIFERLLAARNPVGLLGEDLDPRDGSLWGNFPQTYSHVGLINAAFALSPPW